MAPGRFALATLAVIGSVLVGGPGPAGAADWRPVPRPVLDEPLTPLRVVYAVNPRLPRLDRGQIAALLTVARGTVREHFGLEIAFTEPDEIGIERLFDFLPARLALASLGSIFDFKGGTGDVERLVEAMREGLAGSMRMNGTTLEEEYAFAAPYLLREPASPGLDAFARALVETMLIRLAAWRTERAADQGPVVDDSPYNEWVFWDILGYGDLPYDVVLTNQIVASAEYSGLAVHSSLRGGISAGTTSYSRRGPYHSYVFLSTFPFSNAYDALLGLRGQDRYTPAEQARFAGAYLAHELGHQLLHLGHPFGVVGCVMRPAELLDFRRWHASLDAARCPLGGHPAMTVGPARIFYDPRW